MLDINSGWAIGGEIAENALKQTGDILGKVFLKTQTRFVLVKILIELF